MRKKHLFFPLLYLLPLLSLGQQKGIISKIKNRFLSSTNDSSRNSSYMILPALGYAPEKGFELGVAATYDFYVDKQNPDSRTSNLTTMGTFTTTDQRNIKLQSNIWTKNNDYHIISELRFRNWPMNYYGLGNLTAKADEDLIVQKIYRVKAEIEKKITANFYLGGNLLYEHLTYTSKDTDGIFAMSTLEGKEGGQYATIGVSALYDSRNTINYSTSGFYSRLKTAYAPKIWEQDSFTGIITELDNRYFYPISTKVTTAAQVLYRGVWGKNVPFYLYNDLGGDMSMRGYYQGRYRDKNYLATQAELRYRIIPRLGTSVFGGTGTTFSEEYKPRWAASYGAGIRYFFSLEHNSNIRFDYAIGEKRPGEARQKGFYLSLSEAF